MENTTLDRRIDSSVLYFGLNGYGITWIYVIVHIFMALVALLGIFLNVFSLFVINRKEHGTDMSIIFISNLACSDFVYDIWGLYLVLYNMVHYKNYYECAFRFGLAIGICFNSLLQLLALTVDRFTKIIYPYQYVRIFKERSANIFCVLSWSFSGLFGLLPLLGVRKPMTHGTAYCSFFGVLDDFYLILVTTLFCLVFVMLIACYIRIWWASFTQSKHMYGPGRIRHLWLSPTKTIVILIVFYCLCWFPLGKCSLSGSRPIFANNTGLSRTGELEISLDTTLLVKLKEHQF